MFPNHPTAIDPAGGVPLRVFAVKLSLIIGALVGTLSGCGVDDALHRVDLSTYRRHCNEFGFVPGTDAFARCLQQQSTQRANENQQTLDRIHLDEAADKVKK